MGQIRLYVERECGEDIRNRMLEKIDHYWIEHSHGPSIRELAMAFDTSTSVIAYHLKIMAEKGMVVSPKGQKARGIIPAWVPAALNRWWAGK